MYLWISIEEFF